MLNNNYYFDTMLRVYLVREHPELLAKLDEQTKKENREVLRAIAKRHGVRVRVFDETNS